MDLSETTESAKYESAIKVKISHKYQQALELMAFQSEQNVLNSHSHSSFGGQANDLLSLRCYRSSATQ